MDIKGFQVLESAIQWVVDEDVRKRSHIQPNGLEHDQMAWAVGELLPAEQREALGQRFGLGMTMVIPLCASACCVAGNVVIANGDLLVAIDQFGGHTPDRQVKVDFCVTEENEVVYISTRARDLLGISEVEADLLFEGHDTPERVVAGRQADCRAPRVHPGAGVMLADGGVHARSGPCRPRWSRSSPRW